ncbi:mannose 6-phosphate receptor domain-containing protein [Sistotremastrum suecicum HHB10207 ss-3]|uniref:Mannose 6-phosphate receptor domain-containing protein n=1 Tax=Sistotremastrum suecicum HHB10207 ss-3 TaxID=1314776 RepID=A0A166IJY0_9AGAM|nr:mannose 6-phosphate receptor domain-containing protein [Sistotremastrum suecicum HHB10207 ss-3]
MLRLLISSLLFVSCTYAQDSCTTTSNGYYYDLNSLQAKTDYEVKTEGRTYKLNVCRGLASEFWNPVGVDRPEDMGAKFVGEHGDFSIGQKNSTLVVEDNNPILIYSGGSPCPGASNLKASTAVRFICDTTVSTGAPVFVAQLPPDPQSACAFVFEWRTNVACSTRASGFFGRVMVVLLTFVVVIFLAYFVTGTLYRRYVLQFRGVEQFPTVAPAGLFKACQEAYSQARDRVPERWSSGLPIPSINSWSDHARSGFRRVPQEEEGLVGNSRYSLEDDEEAIPNDPPLVDPSSIQASGEGRRDPGMDNNGVIRL